jgi:hypothetical protein
MAKRLRSNEAFRDKRVSQDIRHGRMGKHPGDTKCPDCSLVFQDGVWKRAGSTVGANPLFKLCPACQQVRDGRIGGIVEFNGSFTMMHREELLNRIRNLEKHTMEERPMERIISIKEERSKIVVSATTEHLVAKIGKAVQRDFGGELELKYAPEEKFAKARWHRD